MTVWEKSKALTSETLTVKLSAVYIENMLLISTYNTYETVTSTAIII